MSEAVIGYAPDHVLKCWPAMFERVWRGEKPFEVRWDDRGYQKGDLVELQEWDPEIADEWLEPGGDVPSPYTGRTWLGRITFVLRGGQFGICPGYVVFGMAPERAGRA